MLFGDWNEQPEAGKGGDLLNQLQYNKKLHSRSGQTMYLHFSTVVSTGDSSSSTPNLQQVPLLCTKRQGYRSHFAILLKLVTKVPFVTHSALMFGNQ